MKEFMNTVIHLVKKDDHIYDLQITFQDDRIGELRFRTFNERLALEEAEYRLMQICARYGFDREHIPVSFDESEGL